MTNDGNRVDEIFRRIVKLAPAERSAILHLVCGHDAQLRQRVEALLEDHTDSNFPPALSVDQIAATFDSDSGQKEPRTSLHESGARQNSESAEKATSEHHRQMETGAVIAGQYALQNQIGEGGMGEVWAAKQTAPIKRRVALKLIKAGMDSRAVLARFAQERQALALMDHPNIARVLDGGMTTTGQPFFVMELVNGLPLDKFCDQEELSLPRRLELFVPICQAVQHAHQKGIVHRDLKPANIMVSLVDGKPVPKVIDFGVAKAIGGKLIDESMTQIGAVVGTLEYMSPEQAGFSGEDIDTRADIYSLGVILYELLTGLRPIDKARLKKAAITEMIRIIREEEPSKPSTRLSTDESLPSLAAVRQSDPHKLMNVLRGELDWVVMKCLEKDRERRYETTNGLLRDIRRYLADEPVEARPPSTRYRLRKFLKRNKGPAIAASLLMLSLVAGFAGTAWGLIEAKRQERIAVNAAAEKEIARQAASDRAEGERVAKLDAEKKRAEAETEKRIAQAVKDFLQEKLLGQADVTVQANSLLKTGDQVAKAKRNPTILELLDRAAGELAKEKIEANFPNQPLVQAEILRTVGVTYRGIGEYKRAIPFLERALELRKKELGANHRETLITSTSLATSYRLAGQMDKALPLLEESLRMIQVELGDEDPNALNTMNALAQAYLQAGQLDKAVPLLEKNFKLKTAELGNEDSRTLVAMGDLAYAYMEVGDLDKGLPLAEKSLAYKKRNLGEDHPETLTSMNNLAMALMTDGQLEKALQLFEESLQLIKAKFGDDDPRSLGAMSNLASVYQSTDQLDKAVPLYEESLRLMRIKLGPKHPYTLMGINNLAQAYHFDGNSELAVPLLKESLEWIKDPAKRSSKQAMLADNLVKLEDFAEAEPVSRKCLATREKIYPDHWLVFNSKVLVGRSLLGQEKFAEAEKFLADGYDGMNQREQKMPSASKINLIVALENLIKLYEATGEKDEAAKWQSELAQRQDPDHQSCPE